MPTPVPYRPSNGQLRAYEVGKPVSQGHGDRLAGDLLYLLGHCVQPVYSGWIPKNSASGNAFYVAYWRSPYVQLLRVVIELWDSGTGNDSVNVSLTVAGGAATIVGGSSFSSIRCPTSTLRTIPTYEAYVDVTGVSSGALTDLGVAWTTVSGGAGIARVSITEVPLADASPASAPATEPGINGAWPKPPNLLVADQGPAGSAATGAGFVRALDQLNTARTGNRIHHQLVTTETTASAWTTSATSLGALTWTGMPGGADPVFGLRARRLYDTGTANQYVLRCRYRADSGGVLSINVNGTGTSLTLGATAGAFAASGTVAVAIPTNTTNQEFFGATGITFKGSTALAANPLYLSAISLVENEA